MDNNTSDDLAEILQQLRTLQDKHDALAEQVNDSAATTPAVGVVSAEADLDGLQAWVDDTLCPMLTDPVHPTNYPTWCVDWHQHPLHLWLFESLYLSWQQLDDPASRKWWAEQLSTAHGLLWTDNGLFPLCTPTHHARQANKPVDQKAQRPERKSQQPQPDGASPDLHPANNEPHTFFTAALEPVTGSLSPVTPLNHNGTSQPENRS